MIMRFELRRGGRRLPRGVSVLPWLNGWVVVAGLTVLFVGWLVYRTAVHPHWLTLLPPVIQEFMSLSEVAGAFTLGFLWVVLWWRGRERPFSPAPAYTRDQLYALSPADFERYVARLFRRKGYQVRLRGRSGDQGVDLELVNQYGKRAIVQCKRYRHTVGPDLVRELYGTLIHERVAHAFLVTTADISESAREWARHKPMTLIDGETLVQIAAILDANHSE